MSNKTIQLRKGIFELVILGILKNEDHYGYSLIRVIMENTSFTVNEGTIYPILSRMSKEGLVNSNWVESQQGPPRKYYFLTEKGREAYTELKQEFIRLAQLVQRVSSGSTIVKKRAKSEGAKKIKMTRPGKN